MSKMGSHYSFGHLKLKLWPKEGSGASLTPDQKNSGIDPIYLAADDVRHIVGKLWTRATTLLHIAPQSEVFSQSYGAPKLRESRLARFRDSQGREKRFGCGPRGEVQSIL
jgi:hypothetical protein